jgi:hypothetical protein
MNRRHWGSAEQMPTPVGLGWSGVLPVPGVSSDTPVR